MAGGWGGEVGEVVGLGRWMNGCRLGLLVDCV